MNIDETAKAIGEEVFQTIERNRRLVKDDIVEAARKVLARVQITPDPTGMLVREPVAREEESWFR